MKLYEVLRLSAVEAAPKLLGWQLCRRLPNGIVLRARIVETEAYHQDDPASHSSRGETVRTAPMFKPGGHLYVYFTYGMHHCLNIVVGPAGRGEAVLLRAAEPVEGIEILKKNRNQSDERNLTNGPAKLTQAFGISDTKLSGLELGDNSLWLEPPKSPIRAEDVKVAPRIGITRAIDKPWRFYLRDNPYVSKV